MTNKTDTNSPIAEVNDRYRCALCGDLHEMASKSVTVALEKTRVKDVGIYFHRFTEDKVWKGKYIGSVCPNGKFTAGGQR